MQQICFRCLWIDNLFALWYCTKLKRQCHEISLVRFHEKQVSKVCKSTLPQPCSVVLIKILFKILVWTVFSIVLFSCTCHLMFYAAQSSRHKESLAHEGKRPRHENGKSCLMVVWQNLKIFSTFGLQFWGIRSGYTSARWKLQNNYSPHF